MLEIAQGIWQIRIPFENIYTSAFLLTEGGRSVLLDNGTTQEDAREYILPAVETAPELLLCSHLHSDHCGGTEALLSAWPDAKVGVLTGANPYPRTVHLHDGDVLLGRFEVLNLPGHTPDAMAIFDRATKTLLTCDCLQWQGVGRYGTGVLDAASYRQSIARLRTMDIARIVASHDYEPMGGDSRDIPAFLDGCVAVADELRAFAQAHDALSSAEVAALFAKEHPHLPPVGPAAFETFKNH